MIFKPTAVRAITFDAMDTLIRMHKSPGQVLSALCAPKGSHVTPDLLDAQRPSLMKKFIRHWPCYTPNENTPLIHKLPHTFDSERLASKRWWLCLVSAEVYASAFDVDPALLQEHVPTLANMAYEHFAQAKAYRLIEGAQQVLQSLEPHYQLAILSNFDERLHQILHDLPLTVRVSPVLLCAETGYAKPNPAAFEHAVQMLGLTSADQLLHVGDSPHKDVQAAHLAGCQSVLFHQGAQMEADLVDTIHALRDLPRLLQGNIVPTLNTDLT